MNDVNRSACSLETVFARGADPWTRGDVESDWRRLDRGQRWSKTRDKLTLLIRLSFILGKIRGTLPPNIFLLPVKHLRPGTFHDKAQAAKQRRGLQRLGAIERKLKTDTRRVEASSRGRERGITGKIVSTPCLSQIPTITKPQSVSFRYSDLGLQRCKLVGALSYLMAIAVVSSLCAQDSNNKSCFVDNSQLQKLVLTECLTSSGYATLIIPPTYRSPRAS